MHNDMYSRTPQKLKFWPLFMGGGCLAVPAAKPVQSFGQIETKDVTRLYVWGDPGRPGGQEIKDGPAKKN